MSERDASSKSYLPDGMPVPVPSRDGVDRGFYDGLRRHELMVQRCDKCRTFQFPAEWICYKCHTMDPDWHRVSGRAVIYSWERVWHPAHPALRDSCPYLVVVVELPDAGNVRMVGNLLGDSGLDPTIGAEVEAVFEDHPDAVLVQWRLAK